MFLRDSLCDRETCAGSPETPSAPTSPCRRPRQWQATRKTSIPGNPAPSNAGAWPRKQASTRRCRFGPGAVPRRWRSGNSTRDRDWQWCASFAARTSAAPADSATSPWSGSAGPSRRRQPANPQKRCVQILNMYPCQLHRWFIESDMLRQLEQSNPHMPLHSQEECEFVPARGLSHDTADFDNP